MITIDFNADVSLQALDADQFVVHNASAIELSGNASRSVTGSECARNNVPSRPRLTETAFERLSRDTAVVNDASGILYRSLPNSVSQLLERHFFRDRCAVRICLFLMLL